MAESKLMFSKSDLRKLIIPLLIEQVLALTVGMIDTIMVASAGESAVSGVSLVDTINILIINIFTALATGGAILAGQYLGRKDRGKSRHAATQLVLTTLIFSVAIMVLCLIFNGGILNLIYGNVEADVMANSRTYFYVTAISFPFIALYNSSAALFRGMGNSRVSMINALIMNVINIVGNYIFIFICGWGVFGAALATLIARATSAITMTGMLRNPNHDICVRSYNIFKLDTSMIKRILRIGIPTGLENSMFQIGKIMLTSLIAVLGTSAIAANAVSHSVAIIAIIPTSAMGMAIMSIVAQCMGAGEEKQAEYYTKKLVKLGYISGWALNIAIILLLKPILGMYQLTDATFDMAYQVLLLHSIGVMVIFPLAFTITNAFRAAGDVKFPMVISIVSMWVFRIGMAYLMVYGFHLGLMGVWIAMQTDWLFRSILFVWRWVSGKWKKNILDTPSAKQKTAV